jgi:hypothetical protein
LREKCKFDEAIYLNKQSHLLIAVSNRAERDDLLPVAVE